MARRLPLFVLAPAILVLGLAAAPASAAGPTNDPESGGQWGLVDIKAPEVWGKATGANIKVAVVSSGFGQHPDLTAKTDAGFDATGTDATLDTGGRGTHIAGIVGATTNNSEGIAGVAPAARLLPYKGFESDRSVSGPQYLEALQRALRARPQVVLVDVPDGFPGDSGALLRQSLKNLGDAGISVVVGSVGIRMDDLPVLVVAATSSSGGRAAGSVGAGGVGAPGADVLSATSTPSLLGGTPTYGYGTMSGTSQAAAHAAGALAILRGLGASSGQAADLLRRTARKNPDTGLGAGIIDVAAAVAAQQTPPPAPSTTATTKKATTTPGAPGGAGGGNGAATGVGAIPPGLSGPARPGGPVMPGDIPEPGEEDAVIPPGAEEFSDLGDSGGPSSRSTGDDRPIGLLAIGFGLLCGVGSGLSLTFRRLADAPL